MPLGASRDHVSNALKLNAAITSHFGLWWALVSFPKSKANAKKHLSFQRVPTGFRILSPNYNPNTIAWSLRLDDLFLMTI